MKRGTTEASQLAVPVHTFVLYRRGHSAPLQQHSLTLVFSKDRMSDDWISFDKAKMHSVLDGDMSVLAVRDAVPSMAEAPLAVSNLQVGVRVWPEEFEASQLLPQKTRQRHTSTMGEASRVNWDKPSNLGNSMDAPFREFRCHKDSLTGSKQFPPHASTSGRISIFVPFTCHAIPRSVPIYLVCPCRGKSTEDAGAAKFQTARVLTYN